MKRILTLLLVVSLLVGSISFAACPIEGSLQKSAISLVPPNEGKIAAMLIKQGAISKSATPEEIESAVNTYLHKKMTAAAVINSEADKQSLLRSIVTCGEKNLDYTNLLHGKKFGKGMTTPQGASNIPWNGEVKKARLLILLAEFGNDVYDDGPLHNNIEKPGVQNNSDMWVKNFSLEHYNRMLFTKGGYDAVDKDGSSLHLDSMIDYYLEQSGGSFRVEGNSYGWFKLPHSEAYYGDNTEDGTDDKAPGNPRDLVKDVLSEAAKAGVPFEDYDLEDPYDLDTDGNFYEPDGIVDRLVIVHAGIDESGGGGAQGTNALWAHSWDLGGLYKIPGTEIRAYNYIMQGENGSIGVFCHEFAHDLGIPDEYDTRYSGNGDAVGFYSLMSSGSWTGKPLGTKPASISPWGRIMLQGIYGGNWIRVKEVDSSAITKDGVSLNLDQSTVRGTNSQVIKVNLPKQAVQTVAPFEGSYEWFSQNKNDLNTSMATTLTLPESSHITLDFWTWFFIEEGYDYAYIDVSTNNGINWTNLKTYNGSSNGWINEKIDLSPYSGKQVKIRFMCTTDGGYLEKGIYLDSIKVVTSDGNVIFQDNAETDTGSWEYRGNGFTRYQGFEHKDNYYLIEWRTPKGTDAALNYGYNWVDPIAGTVEFFPQEPGMLVWYANDAYVDNWVGIHPGYGFLGIVDSHPTPIVANGVDIRTRIQIHDASFSLTSVPDKVFTFFGKTKLLQGKQAVPEFSDSQSYWNNKAPSAGLQLPKFGLKFKVAGQSQDNSTTEIVLYK
ncbi:MAG: immune inhibitor A [Clostridia bacterium]|nr:immune inhibitor A [Clostridia bacterium]